MIYDERNKTSQVRILCFVVICTDCNEWTFVLIRWCCCVYIAFVSFKVCILERVYWKNVANELRYEEAMRLWLVHVLTIGFRSMYGTNYKCCQWVLIWVWIFYSIHCFLLQKGLNRKVDSFLFCFWIALFEQTNEIWLW